MKFHRPILSALVTAALLAGCGKPDHTSGSGPKALSLAFVTNNAADFWTIARKGTEKAEKDLENVQVNFLIPSDATAAEQKRILDDLLAKGVEGIAISPIDPANQIQLINDTAKKALVFTQDSDAPNSDRICYIGTDNHAAGRQAGEMIKKALPNGGKIMVFVGKSDAQNAKDRYQGLKDALKGPTFRSWMCAPTTPTTRAPRRTPTDTLVNIPDVAGLVGLWSYNGPAIVSAVKDAGKVGKVKIVCFDEEDETLAGVKDGAIFATIVQQPYEFGYQSHHELAKYLRGDKSVVPDEQADHHSRPRRSTRTRSTSLPPTSTSWRADRQRRRNARFLPGHGRAAAGAQGHQQAIRRRHGPERRQPGDSPRRSRRADRRERRRQVHADEDPRRRPPAGRGRDSRSTASRVSSGRVNDAMRPASASSTRN